METFRAGLGGGVQPAADAANLARDMLNQEPVMREILEETLDTSTDGTVHESGRTVCGNANTIHGPLARFPTSVKLASCPRGVSGGTWHTHVTKDQLISPTNSLPDMANVVFGSIDASIVVGVEDAEAFVAPADPDAGLGEFQDALGVHVQSAEDVVDAIIGGQVPDPPDARRRVRSRMSSLFMEHRTGYSDLRQQIEQSGIPAHSTVSFEMVDAQHHAMVAQQLEQHTHRRASPLRDPASVREEIRRRNAVLKSIVSRGHVGQRAGEVAVGEAIRRAIVSIV